MKRIISTISIAALALAHATGVSAYTVRPGDTLSAIASRFGTTYRELAEANNIADPDLIFPGQEVSVPSAQAPAPADASLGALPDGVSLPRLKAGYTDSLAERMLSDSSAFTLVKGYDSQGRSLSGTYGFTIDEGTTRQEYVIATCASTACQVDTRGVDIEDADTSVPGNRFEHRRAAEVKITDYPIIGIMRNILNGEVGASSTFMLGDGTPDQDKYIRSYNGSLETPFIKYNESLGQWEFSNDGSNSFVFSETIGAPVTAAPDGGLEINSSEMSLVPSSTGSIAIDSGNHVYVSPTFRLPASFLSTLSVSGTSTLSGTALPYPVSASSATPKSYVDTKVQSLSATGTADGTVSYGMALYASSTSRLGPTDTASASSTFRFVGVAVSAATAGNEVSYVRPGGIVCGLSGLTPGVAMYLSGSSGAMATTPGALTARVGMALSSTCMQVSEPKYYRTGSATIGSTGDYFQATGFYPAKLTLVGGAENSAISGGSVSDDGGTLVLRMQGANNSAIASGSGNTYQCFDVSAGIAECAGSVTSRTPYGFTVNVSNSAVTHVFYWTAESL